MKSAQLLGLLIFHLRLCCELKKRQSRHEERLLVILNKRRATQSGAFSVTTRGAGAMKDQQALEADILIQSDIRFFIILCQLPDWLQ